MKYILLVLAILLTLLVNTAIYAEPVTGTLVMPTHREDGVIIKVGELAKVKVEFKEINTNNFTNIELTGDMTQFSVTKPPGTYEIYATVFDTEGRESQPSNTITRVIDFGPPIIVKIAAPNAPILLIIEPETAVE